MISVVAVTATGGKVGMTRPRLRGHERFLYPKRPRSQPQPRTRPAEPVDVRTLPPIAARAHGPLDPARGAPGWAGADEADARAGSHGARRPARRNRADAAAPRRRAARARHGAPAEGASRGDQRHG